MYNIKEKCIEWSSKTFKEELNHLNISDKLLYNTTLQCFDSLKLCDKKINGYACENLPKTEEGYTGIRITYSELFHEVISEDNFSPITYLLKLVHEFLKLDINSNKLNGAMARGLRTFSSLLREPDFAYKIEQYLKCYDKSVSTNLNSKQDSGDHTDVLLHFKENQFRMWLFQFSSRGLPHDIERISGKRGELPNGIHILCPLHTEFALKYEEYRLKEKRINERINRQKKSLENCSKKAIKTKNDLKNKIEKNYTILNNIINNKNIYANICSNELDIVEGWFFYSDKHIKRIVDFIINNPTIDNYQHVKEIITAPERYLSEIRIFNK